MDRTAQAPPRRRWLSLAAGARFFLPLPIFGLLVFGFGGEIPRQETGEQVAHHDVAFASGDVIFRRGTSLLSRAVLWGDGRSQFSHTGIVRLVAGAPLVIHAAPGASLAEETKITIEPIASFLDRSRATAAALYRPRERHLALGEEAAAIAHGYAVEERIFDAGFRLETEAALYCTELVWRAYLEAGLDLVDGELDQFSFPLHQGPGLLPSRLQMSPYLHLVHDFASKGRLQ